MPRTTLTKIAAPGGYSHTGQTLTWTAADVANGNQFVTSGKEIVLARNVHADTARTVTVASTPILGRTKDITAFSIAAGAFAAFGPFPSEGWRQADGFVYLNASHVDIQFAVIAIP
jgi:hypothetical protein